MSDLLVYQTSDPQFADKAIEALAAAGIEAFQTGRGYVDLTRGRHNLGNGICIYIADSLQSQQANQILIELGAVVETPPKLPSRPVIFLIVAVFAALVFYIATATK